MSTSATDKITVTKRTDYQPSAFLIKATDLKIVLAPTNTSVTANLTLERNPDALQKSAHLILNGQALQLKSVAIDDRVLTQKEYQVTSDYLTLFNVPEKFVLTTEVITNPSANTALHGLYISNNIFCTQCEAEGFRRITYYLDRPDVMACFTTTLIADQTQYPELLSNGNAVKRGKLENNQHFVTWEDPFKKPAHLFALVAGKLEHLSDTFTTMDKREVTLKVFVEPGQVPKAHHAMDCLKKAMQWDEEVYGRAYDLSIFMVVAISDFNMGAMENKGLNIFNSKYILADGETATDVDYRGILTVVAHEYFHNWTGNRVNCRDWFQLTLKEGLTVFRDQEFTADQLSRDVIRIEQVKRLRNAQFQEDAGPMAHPIRPDSYIEINNFYTPTVYEKGAEVIRMAHAILGQQGFRQGTDCYFNRHDGQAVTVDDFIKALEDGAGVNLSQFRLWYSTAGTPHVFASGTYCQQTKQYTVRLKQMILPTPGQPEKPVLHIPLSATLYQDRYRMRNEKPRPALKLATDTEEQVKNPQATRVLSLTEVEQEFVFIDVENPPILSLNHGFSAPIILHMMHTDRELAYLAQHSEDGFARFEAMQTLMCRQVQYAMEHYASKTKVYKHWLDDRKNLQIWPTGEFSKAFTHILNEKGRETDAGLHALLLTLPDEQYLGNLYSEVDVDAIHAIRIGLKRGLGVHYWEDLVTMHAYSGAEIGHQKPYHFSARESGLRHFRALCMHYLMATQNSQLDDMFWYEYESANNMTDRLAALTGFASCNRDYMRKKVLEHFYERWQHDPLVVNKWLAAQAIAELPGALEDVKALTKHPAFNLHNPNKVYALLCSFANNNLVNFHRKDGEGYRFIADYVMQLNDLNPQVAARLIGPLTYFQRYDKERKDLMKAELARIGAMPKLCSDLYEVVTKALAE